MSFLDELDAIDVLNDKSVLTKQVNPGSFIDELESTPIVREKSYEKPFAFSNKEERYQSYTRPSEEQRVNQNQQQLLKRQRDKKDAKIIRHLQWALNNNIPTNPEAVAQFQDRLTIPENYSGFEKEGEAVPMQIERGAVAEPLSMEREPLTMRIVPGAIKQPVPEIPTLPEKAIEPLEQLQPEIPFAPSDLIGDIQRSAASLGLGFAQAGTSALQGIMDLNKSIPTPKFIKNIKEKIGSAGLERKTEEKLNNLASEIGLYRKQISNEIRKEGGVAAEVAQTIADQASETALTLGILGITGFVGKGASVRQAIKDAGKIGALTYVQSPGTPSEKLQASAQTAAFMLTPISAAKMPTSFLAKSINIIENLGITYLGGGYASAVEQAKLKSKEQGTDWKEELLTTITPLAVNDIVFGLLARPEARKWTPKSLEEIQTMIADLPKGFLTPENQKRVEQIFVKEVEKPKEVVELTTQEGVPSNAPEIGKEPEGSIAEHRGTDEQRSPAETGGGNRLGARGIESPTEERGLGEEQTVREVIPEKEVKKTTIPIEPIEGQPPAEIVAQKPISPTEKEIKESILPPSVQTIKETLKSEQGQGPLNKTETETGASLSQGEKILKSEKQPALELSMGDKVKIGKNPQVNTILEKIQQSDIERENNEQYFRVKNDKTKTEAIVEKNDITPVVMRQTGTEQIKETISLNKQLKTFGLEPSVFKNKQEKIMAIKQAKAKPEEVKSKQQEFKLGPGAAAANPRGKFVEFIGEEVGTKNEYTRKMQERLGMDIKVEPSKKDKDLIDESYEIIKDNPIAGDEIARSLIEKHRPISDAEVLVLLHATTEAENNLNRLNAETLQSGFADNPEKVAKNKAATEMAYNRLDDIYTASQIKSREWGRSGRAIQMAMDENFNIHKMIARKRLVANDGKELTSEQLAEVKQIKEKYDKTKTALENHRAKGKQIKFDFEEQRLKEDHDKAIKTWLKSIQRDKLDPKRWSVAINEYIKERKVKIPDRELAEIEKDLKRASTIPDENKRDLKVVEALNKLMPHVPLKNGDWFDAYIYTNMLSGPLSHARNLIGNLTTQSVLRPLNLMFQGKPRGAGIYLKESWKTVFDGSSFQKAIDSLKGGEPGKIETMRDLPEGASAIQKMKRKIELLKRAQGPENKLGKYAWKGLTAVEGAMRAADTYVGNMIEAGSRAEQLNSGVDIETANRRAKVLASQYLYRDRLKVPDRSLDAMSRVLEHFGLVVDNLRRVPYFGRMAKMAVPFLKTPVKIAQLNTQITPLGFIGSIKNRIARANYDKVSYDEMISQLKNEVKKSKPDMKEVTRLQGQIAEVNYISAERRGLASVGTMMTVLGSIAAASGNTIWSAPKDEKAKKLFYDAGYRPYSFKIGNKYIPMIYLGPLMISFAIPAAIRDIMMDNPDAIDDNVVEKATKIALAIPKMLVDQLPLEGISSLMKIMQGEEGRTMSKFYGRTAMQIVPLSGMWQFIRNMVDPTYKKAITVEDTIKAGIPGLSDHVKSLKDSEGLDAKMSIWDALVPYKIGTVNKEKQEKYKEQMELLKEKMKIKNELES